MTFEVSDAVLPAAAHAEPCDARTLSNAVRATRMQFAALGMIGGAWGVHIPSVKAQYALGEAMLSTVLLAAATGAVIRCSAPGG